MHANAPLTPEGRLRLFRRIESGWTVAATAESMNVSRQTAHKWWRRFCEEGIAGLQDRSSRPRSCPHQTPSRVERRIVALRQSRKLGPARLAGIVDVPASTVHRVLVRHGVNRLRWMDRPTGRVIRRIETSRCGELVHIDVKKLARIPDGGGHKKLGRTTESRRKQNRSRGGYAHIHTAIDAYSRLAYSEFAGTENTDNCVAFLDRAITWFADQGITVEQLKVSIDSTTARFEMPTEFVVPGGSVTSAALDVARTVVRRAERESLAVADADSRVIAYLNRLSDLLWALARWQEQTSTPSRETN